MVMNPFSRKGSIKQNQRKRIQDWLSKGGLDKNNKFPLDALKNPHISIHPKPEVFAPVMMGVPGCHDGRERYQQKIDGICVFVFSFVDLLPDLKNLQVISWAFRNPHGSNATGAFFSFCVLFWLAILGIYIKLQGRTCFLILTNWYKLDSQ